MNKAVQYLRDRLPLKGKAQMAATCRAGQLLLGGLLQINLAQSLGINGLSFSAPLMSVAQNVTNVIPLNWDAELVRRKYSNSEQIHGALLVVSTFRMLVALLSSAAFLLVLTGLTGKGFGPFIYLGLFGFVAAASWNPSWYLQKTDRVDYIVYAQAVSSVVASIIFLTCRELHLIKYGVDIYITGAGSLAAGLFVLSRGIDAQFRAVRIKVAEAGRLLKEIAWKSRRLTAYSLVRFVYLWADFLLLSWFGPKGSGGEYRVATLVTAFLISLLNLIPLFLYPVYVRLCAQGQSEEAWRRMRRDVKRFRLWAVLACPLFVIMNYAGLFVIGTPTAMLVTCGVMFTYARITGILSTLSTSMLWAVGNDKLPLWAVMAGAAVSIGLNVALIPHYGLPAAATAAVLSEMTVLLICSVRVNPNILPAQHASMES